MMIGDKLKELRQSFGMNKKEFANLIGLKYTTYNNYEIGAREPASDFLIMISNKFDISIDYLMGLTNDTRKPIERRISSDESTLLESYASLDAYGKDLVNTIIEKELLRILNQRD